MFGNRNEPSEAEQASEFSVHYNFDSSQGAAKFSQFRTAQDLQSCCLSASLCLRLVHIDKPTTVSKPARFQSAVRAQHNSLLIRFDVQVVSCGFPTRPCIAHAVAI